MSGIQNALDSVYIGVAANFAGEKGEFLHSEIQLLLIDSEKIPYYCAQLQQYNKHYINGIKYQFNAEPSKITLNIENRTSEGSSVDSKEVDTIKISFNATETLSILPLILKTLYLLGIGLDVNEQAQLRADLCIAHERDYLIAASNLIRNIKEDDTTANPSFEELMQLCMCCDLSKQSSLARKLVFMLTAQKLFSCAKTLAGFFKPSLAITEHESLSTHSIISEAKLQELLEEDPITAPNYVNKIEFENDDAEVVIRIEITNQEERKKILELAKEHKFTDTLGTPVDYSIKLSSLRDGSASPAIRFSVATEHVHLVLDRFFLLLHQAKNPMNIKVLYQIRKALRLGTLDDYIKSGTAIVACVAEDVSALYWLRLMSLELPVNTRATFISKMTQQLSAAGHYASAYSLALLHKEQPVNQKDDDLVKSIAELEVRIAQPNATGRVNQGLSLTA